MKISAILTKIELGLIDLPRFQRGYVWKRRQVRAFFDSLYRKHPVGSLLTWLTKRDDGTVTELLLDGQQRVTSLYGVIKGKPPDFFSGDRKAFSNLHFHVEDERFEFFQPIKMRDDPLWFDVTKVMQAGTAGLPGLLEEKLNAPGVQIDSSRFIAINNRLLALLGITDADLHIEQVTDPEKSVDTVVDIFNRLNSAGTKLSSGDLALARIATRWPKVRKDMGLQIETWRTHGLNFSLDWLLRCVNTVVNGEAAFQHLHDTPGGELRDGLRRTIKHIDAVLNQISQRLGLDHDRVLFGRFSIPVLVRHLELRTPGIIGTDEWNRILYWFLQAGMRGRFSGTTETKIRQDLVTVDGTVAGMDRLIADIGRKWGRRQVTASDFDSWSIGARTYPVLYWLTRVSGAKNFCDGAELQAGLLGQGAQLQVHHIFPKAVLYQADYKRPEVNALGNFCFLTATCNQWIGAARPTGQSRFVKSRHDAALRRIAREGYFAFVQRENPGALESQWIPMEPELWKVENYRAFLEARRSLLAAAANQHLTSLYPPHAEALESAEGRSAGIVRSDLPVHVSSANEEEELGKLQAWMSRHSLASGEFGYELRDEDHDHAEVIIDLAWPSGLPEGRGRPVALLLNEPAETYRTVSQAGFDCHTSVETFERYVEGKILG